MSDTRTMTMTLPEFLLARIAEDELYAPAHHMRSCLEFVGQSPCSCYYPDRILAECVAKRRIAELRHSLEPAGRSVLKRIQDPGKAEMLVAVCKLLAQPYAAHPDYLQEWRV